MNVYKVTINAQQIDGYLFWTEGPIYVSGRSYTEVEEKLRHSKYTKRTAADITLLGPLDDIEGKA